MSFDETIREAVAAGVAQALEQAQQREWLKPAEVAGILGCHRSTVYEKIEKGVIPSHVFDGQTYVSRRELDEAIAAAPSAARREVA